jgi:hypothetical protein
LTPFFVGPTNRRGAFFIIFSVGEKSGFRVGEKSVGEKSISFVFRGF